VNKSRVALLRCDTYDEQSVSQAVKDGIELMGGLDSILGADESVLLKPNVLAGDDPAKCISPHPAVFKAVAAHMRERTSRLAYGDSPGFGQAEAALRKAGLALPAQELGLQRADFESGREMRFEDSPFIRRFIIANGVLAADGLINISKMKTHAITRFTGAVKNQFGIVPGMYKKGFHIKIPDAHDFARMLVSLNLAVRARLYIMDAVMAMQGNGPRGGTPIAMRALLFSTDPVALDAVACRLMDLDPLTVPTSKPGREWGLGTCLPDEIELKGDDPAGLVNGDFDVERGPFRSPFPKGMGALVKNLIARRPAIDEQKCVRCGLCVHSCPVEPKALEWRGKSKDDPPVYRYRRCIRCFCCQEICPEGAIYVKPSILPVAGREN
jgi:uncharacterized protein (DUF362 family)/ferredoxin